MWSLEVQYSEQYLYYNKEQYTIGKSILYLGFQWIKSVRLTLEMARENSSQKGIKKCNESINSNGCNYCNKLMNIWLNAELKEL